LKRKHDELLSSFAFNFNLRHYTEGGAASAVCIFLHGLGDTGHGGTVQVDPRLTPS